MPGGIALLLVASLLLPGVTAQTGPSGWTPPAMSAVHAPISIVGDSQFTAANGVVGGNGTADDPYRIANWEFTPAGSAGISIAFTTAAFVISNVMIVCGGYSAGIDLVNVARGELAEIRVTSCWEGVHARGAQDLRIHDSNASGNRGAGFVVTDSARIVVADSVSMNDGSGVIYRNVTGGSIERNLLVPFNENGVGITDSANITVAGNSIAHYVVSWGWDGVRVEGSRFIRVTDNAVSAAPGAGQWGYGIALRASMFVDVERNTLSNRAIFIGGYSEFGDGTRYLGLYDTHTITSDNRVEGLPVLFYKNVTGLTLNATLAGELILVNVTGLLVTDATFVRSEIGILLAYCRDATIRDSDFYLEHRAVAIMNSRRVSVYRNNFYQVGAESSGRDVVWNLPYPIGGNYWSDSGGWDRCSGPGQFICPDPDGFLDNPEWIDNLPAARWINHHNLPPTACYDVQPRTVTAGTELAFNASCSADPDVPSGMTEFRWDWNGDWRFDTNWSGSPSASHRFGRSGTYLVRLEVRDAGGRFDFYVVEVQIQAPREVGPFEVCGLILVLVVVFIGVATYLTTRKWKRAEQRPFDERPAESETSRDEPPKGETR